MADKPIAFNHEMVLALLARRKTQTRRTMDPQPIQKTGATEVDGGVLEPLEYYEPPPVRNCPYGAPGDYLWVRERMRVIEVVGHMKPATAIRVEYEADGSESEWINVPHRLKEKPEVGKCLSNGGFREASRMSLRIKQTGAERLQDISTSDVRAEGVRVSEFNMFGGTRVTRQEIAAITYSLTWNSIYGRTGHAWKHNPFVWVVVFRMLLKNIDTIRS